MGSGWVILLSTGILMLLVTIGASYWVRLRFSSPGSNPSKDVSAVLKSSSTTSSAKYAAQVLADLVLPSEVRGIVGIRQWTWNGSTLTSRHQGYIWTSSKMAADAVPTKENNNGIYAYQLGSITPAWIQHIGIVEMLGRVEVHSDGVLRAEKCKILVIIVNWGNSAWAKEVSSQYHIPVYIANYPELAYRQWFLGADGIKWLNHNYNLLKSEDKYDILKEAEKILGGKS